MPTQLLRESLRTPYRNADNAHPGLLLQRGYEVYDCDTEAGRQAKSAFIRRVCSIQPDAFYHNAYQRWRTATGDRQRFRQVEMALESRLFIGLTGGGMLETGCAMSHTYGAPYIPGSSIKGIVRGHVAASPFAQQYPRAIAELFGLDAETDEHFSQGLSGLVCFHDAWWVPDASNRPLVEEVVTTHHPDYYGKEGAVDASDFDSPIPNAQIAVQGHFLFVLEGPLGWMDLAEPMLIAALSNRGIGAKTRSGYGLFDPMPKANAGPACPWVDETIAMLVQKNRAKPDDVLRGKGLAEAWSEIGDDALKAEALADIRTRWEAQDWWETPPGKAARQAKGVYIDG